jgi:A/G-specific adenine glycosylase
MKNLTEDNQAKLDLLIWFRTHKRDLPFRTKPTAYKIWVSETMLQQTRVAAMLPLYDQFLLRFPDLESLSRANEDDVLESWRGLGYYARARNLRKACIYIMSNYSGRFPEHLEEAMNIPGVGPYTARAVLSIAYGKTYAVLDGNVKRVIARYYAESDEKKWQMLADTFLNRENPGDHNQAMMELGSLVCQPRPNCEACPIQKTCKAYQSNEVFLYPPVKKKDIPLSIQMHFYILMRDEKILLLKDSHRRFLKGMYSLPFLIRPEREGQLLPIAYKNPNYLEENQSIMRATPISGITSHSITNHKIRIFLYRSAEDSTEVFPIPQGIEMKWTDWERLERDFPSSIAKKILKFSGMGGLFPS